MANYLKYIAILDADTTTGIRNIRAMTIATEIVIPKNTLVFETAIDVSILCLIAVYHFQLTAPNTQVQKSW